MIRFNKVKPRHDARLFLFLFASAGAYRVLQRYTFLPTSFSSMRTTSALIWRLGTVLAETVPESSFWQKPTVWIGENVAQISDSLKDQEICGILSIDDLRGLEKALFPRLTAYIYARLKLADINDEAEKLLQSHSRWASMGDITQVLEHEGIQETLVGYASDSRVPLTFSERNLLIDLHRLDLICFTARVLIICSDIQPLDSMVDDDAQSLVNILCMLLNYEHLNAAHPIILDALCRKSALNPDKLALFDITSLLPASQAAPTLLNENELLKDLNAKDIVIAVMGPSGTGKSSFINKLLGNEVAQASDGLQSCTQQVRAFGCFHPRRSDQRIIVVDTPGFDDTNRTDYEVLKEIAEWLESTYSKRIKLSGLLQFHSIRDSRMRRTPKRNLDMFKQLCGPGALKNIILLTTFWDVESEAVGSNRETQLKEEFWTPLIKKGSRTKRFDPPTYECAWDIVDQFSLTPIALGIQIEMVDERKKLWETSAFKFLVEWWTQVVEAIQGSAGWIHALRQKFALEGSIPTSPTSSLSSDLDLKPKWFQNRRLRRNVS